MKAGPVRRRGRSPSDRQKARARHRLAQDLALVGAGLAVVFISAFREVNLALALGIGLGAVALGSFDAAWFRRRSHSSR